MEVSIKNGPQSINPVGAPKVQRDEDLPVSDQVPEEFGRFEQFGGMLVNVPKEEIDKKRAEES